MENANATIEQPLPSSVCSSVLSTLIRREGYWTFCQHRYTCRYNIYRSAKTDPGVDVKIHRTTISYVPRASAWITVNVTVFVTALYCRYEVSLSLQRR